VRPPAAVLERLGLAARPLLALGGLANEQWLVGRGAERAVLRRFDRDRSLASVTYELEVQRLVAARGWPVPDALGDPFEADGFVWCLLAYREGRRPSPRTPAGNLREQRRRGRLLAELHADLAGLTHLGQRDDWVRHDEVFALRPSLAELLELRRARIPAAEAALLREHAERTAQELSDLDAGAQPAIVIHGDFTPWNLRFKDGRLSAVLDWELTHLDLRVAEFALAWRGVYAGVLRGYEEIAPLTPVERELVAPIRRAWLLNVARSTLLWTPADERPGFDWVVGQLMRPAST
jgi:aminoglycoside phosphotransferase (APT) family kinase protein